MSIKFSTLFDERRRGDFMIKIAILDDEEIFRENICKKVYAAYARMHCSVQVDSYDNGKVLYDEVNDGRRYDVYILDVEVPGLSGVELGQRLREISEYCVIIFLTAFPQYAIDGYNFRAYQYILKDEWEHKLESTLLKVQREVHSENDPFYRITVNNKLEKVPVRDIYYASKDRKNVVFYIRTGTTSIRKTLSEVYDELPEGQFIYVDRGCIVNLEHVMKLRNREISLPNGEAVLVSYPQLKEVKKAINDYWREHV